MTLGEVEGLTDPKKLAKLGAELAKSCSPRCSICAASWPGPSARPFPVST